MEMTPTFINFVVYAALVRSSVRVDLLQFTSFWLCGYSADVVFEVELVDELT
uniref:Uncharacterized protein n=1 Tax=Peronospora matthiolae TaxID=2874970 RepID=A0AAV1TIN5_9STRA